MLYTGISIRINQSELLLSPIKIRHVSFSHELSYSSDYSFYIFDCKQTNNTFFLQFLVTNI